MRGFKSKVQRSPCQKYTAISATTARATHHQFISRRSSLSSPSFASCKVHTRLATEMRLITTRRTVARVLAACFSLTAPEFSLKSHDIERLGVPSPVAHRKNDQETGAVSGLHSSFMDDRSRGMAVPFGG